MLKLINIIKTNKKIEANYIPENSDKEAHVYIDLLNGNSHADIIEEYGSMYSRMAINGLKRTLEELENGITNEPPENRMVMWY